MRKLFKERTLFKGGNYMRKCGIRFVRVVSIVVNLKLFLFTLLSHFFSDFFFNNFRFTNHTVLMVDSCRNEHFRNCPPCFHKVAADSQLWELPEGLFWHSLQSALQFWGYTFTQELVSKGTIKNLPIFTQELHYGNYLPTYISLFPHRNYKIVTGY